MELWPSYSDIPHPEAYMVSHMTVRRQGKPTRVVYNPTFWDILLGYSKWFLILYIPWWVIKTTAKILVTLFSQVWYK